jgi:hypothetical protein
MRVCQPGPVAFQRRSVSGGSRIEMAVRAAGDFGRPRGRNISSATFVPKMPGSTSAAGRAFRIDLAVHSGFSLLGRVGLILRFISSDLTAVRFAQAYYMDAVGTRSEDQCIQAPGDEPNYLKAPLPIVPAEILDDPGGTPVELARQLKREAPFGNIPFVLGRVEADLQFLLYIR